MIDRFHAGRSNRGLPRDHPALGHGRRKRERGQTTQNHLCSEGLELSASAFFSNGQSSRLSWRKKKEFILTKRSKQMLMITTRKPQQGRRDAGGKGAHTFTPSVDRRRQLPAPAACLRPSSSHPPCPDENAFGPRQEGSQKRKDFVIVGNYFEEDGGRAAGYSGRGGRGEK